MKIESLPFYFKSHDLPDNGGQPHILPFNLVFDQDMKMFREIPTPELNQTLKEVYLKGSLVDGSISSESGEHYIPELLKYIKVHYPVSTETSILEIGYGSGNFLRALKRSGFKILIGIEPGRHALVDDLEGIELITDFYPSTHYTKKVDLIIHSLVLEHIENPLGFIRDQAKQLNRNGKVIFFVPNEVPFLEAGDCSCFIHEHFNYFTKDSIQKLIRRADLWVEDISEIHGLFAVTCSFNSALATDYAPENIDEIFYEKMEGVLEKIRTIVKDISETDIALYVPGRALNSMYLSNINGARLVDDNTEMHGKYLPYFKNQVESFEMLIEHPPKVILIYSRTFGLKIKNKCLARTEFDGIKIFTLDELG